jgi:hypothetical protein
MKLLKAILFTVLLVTGSKLFCEDGVLAGEWQTRNKPINITENEYFDPQKVTIADLSLKYTDGKYEISNFYLTEQLAEVEWKAKKCEYEGNVLYGSIDGIFYVSDNKCNISIDFIITMDESQNEGDGTYKEIVYILDKRIELNGNIHLSRFVQ